MQADFSEYINIWTPEVILLLIISGFLIGMINTVAGSGTAIGYAVFIALGLPPSQANGTVRIGVLPQTFAAALNFWRHRLLDLKNAFRIALPITAGSILGAQIAVSINQDLFKIVIGIAMVIFMFLMLIKPEKWIQGDPVKQSKKPKIFHYVIYFLIGVYGGFIHIGVGIFLLFALVLLSGYDLVRANSLKVFVVLMYTPFALTVFILNGEIYYAMGLLSAIGNTLGGIVASNAAVKKGAAFLRWVLIIVIAAFSIWLFKIYEIVIPLFK